MYGLYSGNYGYCYSHCSRTLHELEVLAVIEEHLRHSIRCTLIGLLFQHGKVALHVRGLLVFLGVACDAERERHTLLLHCRAVNKETLVETVYLTYKVNGMLVAHLGRGCVRIALALVTTQHKNIVYTRQLKVNERILGVLKRVSVTKDVRHDRHIVAVVYCCSHGHSTRTATYCT